MTKEEIALQLTMQKLDLLQPSTYADSSEDRSGNKNFNTKLGEEIANIFNNVYKNIRLDDTINI